MEREGLEVRRVVLLDRVQPFAPEPGCPEPVCLELACAEPDYAELGLPVMVSSKAGRGALAFS